MKTVETFPHAIRQIEHAEIPMPDGVRLGARIRMPEDAESHPVPAILEYIPYRKNDLTARRDRPINTYLAGHGYAVVRVDLRGAGDSEGIMADEYLPQELQDGKDAIAWIADQPWCDGNIGMLGISWGGFNGLQVAALRPPALKAVITCCSTDDRYADDVHYMGGCLLGEQLSWASIMFALNTLPPDPRHVGERWREMWLGRLQHSGLWLKNWLEHQTRDDFWKHGSICEDFSDVQVPVYAISGWADGYCRAVFRLMESLDVPRKGLVGPWAHKYPHIGVPGPAMGFLQEQLRWWDHWLKGRETGIMDEPMLRLFMQESARPAGWYAERAGRWVAEPAWPSPNVARTPFPLRADGRLGGDAAPEATLVHESPPDVGMMAGKWCAYGGPGDLPGDQSGEDARTLAFETAPLEEPVEIAGDPQLTLEIAVDRPLAQLAARLCDVWPDGASTRVSFGVLNLAHRESHEHPEPLEPGRRYRVTVPMKHVAQRFAAGHRIRIAVSTSYFPMIWPAPERVTLTLYTQGSALELPLRSPSAEDAALPAFGPAEAGPPLETEELVPGDQHWRVCREMSDGSATLSVGDGSGTFRIVENDLTVLTEGQETYRVEADDATTATGEVSWEMGMSRGDWAVSTRTWTRLTADAERFHIRATLEAREGDRIVHEAEWDEHVPRNMV
jgi:hypothetical protein